MPIILRRWLSFVLCLALGAVACVAHAQEGPPPDQHARPAPQGEDKPPPGYPRKLPPDAVTSHSLALPGRTLNFKATAGTIKLMDGKGAEIADVAFVAYLLDGAEAKSRPVTFVFNGGPGAASVWLDLGALGPWRLPMRDGTVTPSMAPALVDNEDTWLDFTDLVFIDPPGTGYSQIVAQGDDARKRLWSVDGDIDALSVVVRRWLANNQRLESPKFIVGESYGGFRGPRLAKSLATGQGVGISGLVLISPVLDFSKFGGVNDAFTAAVLLPSYAAAAREKNGPVARADLADAEQYASGDYMLDYFRGPRDAAAVSRIVDRVAALTGLDSVLVRRLGGRVDKETFLREYDRAHGKVGALYDATLGAYDPEPTANESHWLDPILDGYKAPLASAMMNLYAQRLGWKIDNKYDPLDGGVSRGWDWGRALSPPEATKDLRDMLALDANFRALVTGGLTDVQVPYFGTKLTLDQIPEFGAPGRLVFKAYPGGHMFYMRDASRRTLREDARRLIEGK